MADDVERAIVDALVRHGYAGGLAGEILGGDQVHEVARMLNREVIASLLEGEQGYAKNTRVESSRRDWAAEALRLEMELERERESSRG